MVTVAQSMAPEDVTVDLELGRTHARAHGRGDGLPLVLLHGAEADSSMWDPYAAELGRGRRVYALDLPGSGASEVREGADCSPWGLASWLAEFLASQGHEGCDLLGHSLGGSVALHVASRAPASVGRLVAVSPANLAAAAPAFAEAGEELLALVTSGRPGEERVRDVLARLYERDPSSGTIRSATAYWTQPGVQAFMRAGGLEVARVLPVETLASVTVPTLVIWGSRDRFFPVEGARQRCIAVPDCRLVVLDGAGHSPFEDAREMFMLLVDGFLDGPEDG
jgi:pimeloyl-ACP methyl ester carboxylesterase